MSPLFRRRRTEEPEQAPDADRAVADRPGDDPLVADRADADRATGEDAVAAADPGQDGGGGIENPDGSGSTFDRSRGPWDVSEVASTDGYVDLGGLRLPGRDGMELRLEIDEATDRVTSATVQLEGSAVQLQVFAAPRTDGIWDEIRAEIAAGVTRQGGTADEVPGVFGRELIARIPVRTPDGRTGHQPARFVGVDGPRWFLRAVFHGVAVHEPERAGPVEDVVRDAVVVRGPEAMAPRELLTLRLPDQQPDHDAVTGEPVADSSGSRESRDPLQPFTRGPEITEIR